MARLAVPLAVTAALSISISITAAAAAAGGLDRCRASAFAPLPARVPVPCRSIAASLSSAIAAAAAGSDGGGGGGVFYDADPSVMDAAYESAKQRSAGGGSDGSAGEPSVPPSPSRRSVFPSTPPGSSIPRDVVIVGSGLAGLSTALHLASRTSHHVTLLEREDPLEQMSRTTAGSFAAAGMLAPQSERLPSGPLLDLCLRSRAMYPGFVATVEDLARKSGEEGRKFLWDEARSSQVSKDEKVSGEGGGGEEEKLLEPWSVGFTSTGGFLAPAFAGDAVATWAPPSSSGSAQWLDAVQVRELEPLLHPDVVGGWWFPEDASVDARRLTCSLRAACVGLGVQFMHGEGCAAESLELADGLCRGVRLADGRTLAAESVVLANGSWMRDLLPVPIVPHKGQSLSLRMPSGGGGGNKRKKGTNPPILSRVLFAQDTYIVPKSDGRIVVGATVEAGSYDPSVTPAGLIHVMSNAVRLVPALANLPVEETWAGLRPTTPDKGPILGRAGKFENVYCAGGYWRNGVLLAPKTGQLLGDLISKDRGSSDGPTLSAEDEALLSAFSWDRFTSPGGGDKMAAQARYAASMHPVHSYSTGLGISAAVGTELGFYSDAASAKAERARDRAAMFSEEGGNASGVGIGGSEENAFERAAMLGKSDAASFTLGDDDDAAWAVPVPSSFPHTAAEEEDEELSGEGVSSRAAGLGAGMFNGAPGALTVGSADVEAGDKEPGVAATAAGPSGGGPLLYDDVYKKMSKLKTAAGPVKDAEQSLVPVARIPDLKKSQLKEEREYIDAFTPDVLDEATELETKGESAGRPLYDETTYDGYQSILEKNWGVSEGDIKERMRQARVANRAKVSEIDEAKIGVMVMQEDQTSATVSASSEESLAVADTALAEESGASADLASVYGKIAANKASAAKAGVEMEEALPDARPDPGFRIYHVDNETGEKYEIPPYTRPENMAQLIEGKKKGSTDATDESASPFPTESSESTSTATPNGSLEGFSDGVDGKKEFDETTFDGYQTILESNWGASESDVKERMRRARIANRAKASEIDESKIGAAEMPEVGNLDALQENGIDSAPARQDILKADKPDLSTVYDSIISNKQAATVASGGVEMGEKLPDGRPDPGFRIYHVDPETREKREVPPYTTPQAMSEIIAEEKQRAAE